MKSFEDNFRFHSEISLIERRARSLKALSKGADIIPTIIQIMDREEKIYNLKGSVTIQQLICSVKMNNKLDSVSSFYIFHDRMMLSPTLSLREVAKRFRAEDGFLYLSLNQLRLLGSSF